MKIWSVNHFKHQIILSYYIIFKVKLANSPLNPYLSKVFIEWRFKVITKEDGEAEANRVFPHVKLFKDLAELK